MAHTLDPQLIFFFLFFFTYAKNLFNLPVLKNIFIFSSVVRPFFCLFIIPENYSYCSVLTRSVSVLFAVHYPMSCNLHFCPTLSSFSLSLSPPLSVSSVCRHLSLSFSLHFLIFKSILLNHFICIHSYSCVLHSVFVTTNRTTMKASGHSNGFHNLFSEFSVLAATDCKKKRQNIFLAHFTCSISLLSTTTLRRCFRTHPRYVITPTKIFIENQRTTF